MLKQVYCYGMKLSYNVHPFCKSTTECVYPIFKHKLARFNFLWVYKSCQMFGKHRLMFHKHSCKVNTDLCTINTVTLWIPMQLNCYYSDLFHPAYRGMFVLCINVFIKKMYFDFRANVHSMLAGMYIITIKWFDIMVKFFF